MISYVILAIISKRAIKNYERENAGISHALLNNSSILPKVTLIAPAYNEEVSIIENVRSLLSIKYRKLDLIIVNDGSQDKTLEKLKIAYRLKPCDIDFKKEIETKKVRCVYRSEIITTHRLFVIDKENGGKADALNAGINVANSHLVACVDVDCVLEPDSILKMVKPYLQDKKVIATGGIVRISNSSKVVDGTLVEARVPKKFIERFQFLEYLRAFLIGRMGWSKINGLLIVSGAFGLFRRDIVLKCGGYKPETVGEDMELVVRMRRYMHEKNKKYRVVYIPDPLCWTEVPTSYKILGRQRNRWTRGLMDTLKFHKKLLFNPKYKLMGTISYPYWLLFEWLSPILEFFGLFYLSYKIMSGSTDLVYVLSLIFMVYSYSFMLSCFALLQDELTTFKYTGRKDLIRMIITALLEPIVFHPLTIYWSIKGNIDFFKDKKAWGEMIRVGFN